MTRPVSAANEVKLTEDILSVLDQHQPGFSLVVYCVGDDCDYVASQPGARGVLEHRAHQAAILGARLSAREPDNEAVVSTVQSPGVHPGGEARVPASHMRVASAQAENDQGEGVGPPPLSAPLGVPVGALVALLDAYVPEIKRQLSCVVRKNCPCTFCELVDDLRDLLTAAVPVSGVPTEAVRELAERVAAVIQEMRDEANKAEHLPSPRHYMRVFADRVERALVQRAAETNESGT